MEIVDLIRISGKAAWLVLVLPLLTALGAGAYQTTQAVQFTSTATLAATVKNNGSGQYTRDVAAAVRAQPVIDSAAKTTGVSSSLIAAGITARPITEGGTTMLFTWTGPDRRADKVAVEVARASYLFIARTSYDKIAGLEKAKASTLAQDKAELVDISKTPLDDTDDPTKELNLAKAESARAKTALEKATSDSDKKGAQDKIDAADKRVETLSKQKETYDSYIKQQRKIDEDEKALRTAHEATTEAKSTLIDVVNTPSGLSAGKVTQASPTRALARAVVGGGVIGLLAAVLILVGLQSVSGGRRDRRPVPARPGPRDPRTGPAGRSALDAGRGTQGRPEPARGEPVRSGAGRNGTPAASPNGRASRQKAGQRPANGRPVPDDVDALPWIFGGEERSGRR